MPERKILWFLVIATMVCLTVSVITAPDKDYILLVNTLSVGFVISAIFFFIVVYLPESQKRSRIYRSMKRQYEDFKKSCIGTFLILSSSQEYQHREMLLDQDEFKRYFKNSNVENEKRWDAVANGIQNNEYYLGEILYELRVLNDEIKFVRSAIDIHDEDVFQFLNNLSHIIHRMESTKPEYDDVKSFCRFLWEIFTGWSFIDGYRKTDIIVDMIERIK
ncbi:hypothetical protein GO003_024830 [Methylicorpusculum oleiharenae]|uniref:hypothetical protein n=1 Tax=Methylicorpusculum oleiharenae TaxID=1338687 RepID=UPI001356DA36|nr:hypothetical protein [Methylicorpusculum oleiharenae]MCD2453607.1 hypothetical protein [Methylicorpusculum oleiharenae]